MKKAFTIFAALFTMGAVMAQTIVSTEVEKRNVLIEEFTGVGCGYCPDGHARANAICEQYEGHAWSINIHAGGYATGSGYTTSDGDGIHNEFYSQISGYPCGVVNRGTVQDRGQWAATAASIRQEDAIVNIAAVGEYNSAEGTYTMHIETYYTGNSTQPTNYFNVAVTQDNILGQQSNYGNYNSEYIEGNQYRHMHMLRELLCGQWGIEIPATQGSFFDTTIVFDVPGSISGLDIPDPTDLNFIVFVTETHKNVLNAQKVIISWTAPKLNKVLVSQEADCSLQYNFTAVVVNNTVEDVQGVTLNVDGSDMDFNVLIPSLGSAEIALPSNTISVTGDAVQNCASTKSVSLVSFVNENNETVLVNGATKTADYAQFNIYTVAGPLRLQVAVDGWASEASVELIRQSDCSTEWTWRESTWTNIGPQSASAISQLYDGRSSWATFNPASGLYILRMLDSYGDGWAWTNNSNPSGVWLSDANGSVFADPWGYTNGPSFEQYDYYLNVTTNGDGSFVDIESVEPTVEFNVYPNPATERLNISCGEAVREVSLIDMAGRTVMTTGCVNSIDVSALASGVYVVRVATENGIGMQKFVKE
mgnify:CR=1 FL=1